jgi:L-ascorbate metabolism protein UlaG (beta-lactamase superfamily)
VQLTKHTHSCVRFDDDDRTLVIDPGTFSDVAAALDGADAVLITHEHFDHVAEEPVRAALKSDSRLRLWAPAPVAATFAEFGEQVVTVDAGESFEAAGFAVETFGGQHALIHPLIPIVANVGYVVEGTVYHPGDSFVVPPVPVSTLLLPANAPWSKMAEIIDFTVAMRAPFAYPIHDALVNEAYGAILQRNLVPIVERFGITLGSWDGAVTA